MLVEQVPRRKWKLAFWPVAFCPHWRFGQWHTVHCRYVHWHFSIGVSSGYISGIGIFGYGVLVIGISAVAFCPDSAKHTATTCMCVDLRQQRHPLVGLRSPVGLQ